MIACTQWLAWLPPTIVKLIGNDDNCFTLTTMFFFYLFRAFKNPLIALSKPISAMLMQWEMHRLRSWDKFWHWFPTLTCWLQRIFPRMQKTEQEQFWEAARMGVLDLTATLLELKSFEGMWQNTSKTVTEECLQIGRILYYVRVPQRESEESWSFWPIPMEVMVKKGLVWWFQSHNIPFIPLHWQSITCIKLDTTLMKVWILNVIVVLSYKNFSSTYLVSTFQTRTGL